MAALQYKPPEQFDFEGANISSTWRKWHQRFQLFLKASGNSTKAADVKVAILLTILGERGVDIYNNFTFRGPSADGANDAEDRNNIDTVLQKFEEFCNKRDPVMALRSQFWSYRRPDGQGLDAFANDLRTMATNCKFQDIDTMIRDKLFFSIEDPNMKMKVMGDDGNASLDNVLHRMRTFESSRRELQMASAPKTVHTVQEKVNKHGAFVDKRHQGPCGRCGTTHPLKQCPANGRNCHQCGGQNHFSSVCKSQRGRGRAQRGAQRRSHGGHRGRHNGRRSVHSFEEQGQAEFYIDSIVHNTDETAWFATVNIGQTCDDIEMKLDTGANTNCLPLRSFRGLTGYRGIPLKKSMASLRMYSGETITPVGTVTLMIGCNGRRILLKFHVADVDSPPVLGLQACKLLGLVTKGSVVRSVCVHAVTSQSVTNSTKPMTKEDLLTDYKDNFSGLGKLHEPYDLCLRPGATPVVHPPRRVPLALHDRLKKKLEDMERAGVIRKTDKPTEWVNSLVIVEKRDGSLRLCLDPKDLNKYLMREPALHATNQDVVSQLGGKKIFTVLDQKDSYWQIPLTEKSCDLCTFNTPFGRYSFLRMPFGISVASDILAKRNQQLFGGISNVHMVADDMIVATDSEEEHDRTLRAIMDVARKHNTKFNADKVKFKQRELVFLGNVVSQDGQKPCSEKVKAIREMPDPESKEDLMRIMGMLNYLCQFIPNMSSISAPLRQLLKKDVEWVWNKEHEKSLNLLKTLITTEPVLKFFSPDKATVIQCDASSKALGACLLQEGHPIAFASRSLSTSECNYSQIEKELLAILFAARKFHQYVYGRPVEVHSDHKPLESITRKPLHKASPRLQQMLLQLMRYDLNVKYLPGKHMYIADALSRAYLLIPESQAEENHLEYKIHSVAEKLPISRARLDEILQATNDDAVLRALIEVWNAGWPRHRRSVPEIVRHYWNIRDEIHSQDGLVFCGDKLVIPEKLRSTMLTLVHESHLGMDKCKLRARSIMYWPGLSRDIEDMISKCAVCAKFQRSNQREPLLPHPVPNRAWSKVGGDIFTFDGKDYLVIVDYFSKYPEVLSLNSKTAREMVVKLKSVFARHGIPDVFISDNSPFASMEMRQFAQDWNFELVTSSPTYPRSNGQSERFVQTVKQMLRKTLEDGLDIHLALLNYRDTPIAGLEYSPSQLLMSRRLKTKLPIMESKLMPNIVPNAKADLQRRQDVYKHYYDRGTRPMSKLRAGDSVRMLRGRQWEPAVVSGTASTPRSYLVTTPSGYSIRRNRFHLQTDSGPPPEIRPMTSVSNTQSPEVRVPPVASGTIDVPPCETPPVTTPLTVRRSSRVSRFPMKYKDFDVNMK